MEAIARRAGVGQPALYRRWPSKEAIVQQALLGGTNVSVPIPDTGSLRSDLIEVLDEMAAFFATPTGKVLVALIGEDIRAPAWHVMVVDFLRHRRQLALVVIDRAIARGELPPGTDGNQIFDLIGSPLWVHHLIHRDLETVDVATIVDTVLGGAVNAPPVDNASGRDG